MIQRAVKSRWDIEDRIKSACIGQLIQVMQDKSASHRAKIAAVKTLVEMEKQNQHDEHKSADIGIALGHLELDAIAADLGIDPCLIVDAEATRGLGDRSVESDGGGD